MQRTERTVRAFHGSDTNLVNTAQLVCTLLADHLADFTAADATIDAAFAADFQDKVAAARSVISDHVTRDVVAEKTEIVRALQARAIAKYGDIRHFILQAFPDGKAAQEQFGLGSYKAARNSARRMVDFLHILHLAAVEHEAELVAAGYTAAKIAEVATICEDLVAAMAEQKAHKSQRAGITEDRIKILNACYAKLVQVNAVAQMVFMHSHALQSQFVFRSAAGYLKKED